MKKFAPFIMVIMVVVIIGIGFSYRLLRNQDTAKTPSTAIAVPVLEQTQSDDEGSLPGSGAAALPILEVDPAAVPPAVENPAPLRPELHTVPLRLRMASPALLEPERMEMESPLPLSLGVLSESSALIAPDKVEKETVGVGPSAAVTIGPGVAGDVNREIASNSGRRGQVFVRDTLGSVTPSRRGGNEPDHYVAAEKNREILIGMEPTAYRDGFYVFGLEYIAGVKEAPYREEIVTIPRLLP